MGAPLVLLDDLGEGVFKITLNRPDKRNAMNTAAQAALREALDKCRDRAKVVILTGAPPAFCAGVDLKELRELRAAGGRIREFANGGNSWLVTNNAIREHPAVFIAAVNGIALGGGVTLINSCDLAVMALEAQLGMPEISYGMFPALAGPSTQMRILRKHVAWMVLTGERIDGATAERYGLVNKAVPLAQLHQEVDELARRVARYDAVALDWSKKALNEIPDHIRDWTAALEYGGLVGHAIRAQTSTVQDSLNRFAAR